MQLTTVGPTLRRLWHLPAGLFFSFALAHCAAKVDFGSRPGQAGAAGGQSEGEGAEPEIVCGDGIVNDAESCDDGNALSGDGCAAECWIEQGFTCSSGPDAPSICTSVCGDGIISEESGEQCDLGGAPPDGICDPNCKLLPR